MAGIDFTEGAFLTMDKAAAVLGVLILFIGYILFLRDTAFITGRRKLIERVFFAAMAAAVIGLAFLKPDFFIENAKVTAANIFFDGGLGRRAYGICDYVCFKACGRSGGLIILTGRRLYSYFSL